MGHHHDSYSAIGSILPAFSVGLVSSIVLLYASYVTLGGGEGSYVPLFIMFGPVAIPWLAVGPGLGASDSQFTLFLLAAVFQYGMYGAIIAIGRRKSVGMLTLFAVLLAHYTAYVWADCALDMLDGLHRWSYIMAFGWLHSVGLFEFFLALHAFAFQYACSTPPYRPRLTVPVVVVLVVGASTATALHIITLTVL